MKLHVFAAAVLVFAIPDARQVLAQTKSDRCAVYARNAMANTPTSTGVLRGAGRGAVAGAIFGNAGAGAATGASVVGLFSPPWGQAKSSARPGGALIGSPLTSTCWAIA